MSSFGSSVINKSGKKIAPKGPGRRLNRPAAIPSPVPSSASNAPPQASPATQPTQDDQADTATEEPQAKRRRLHESVDKAGSITSDVVHDLVISDRAGAELSDANDVQDREGRRDVAKDAPSSEQQIEKMRDSQARGGTEAPADLQPNRQRSSTPRSTRPSDEAPTEPAAEPVEAPTTMDGSVNDQPTSKSANGVQSVVATQADKQTPATAATGGEVTQTQVEAATETNPDERNPRSAPGGSFGSVTEQTTPGMPAEIERSMTRSQQEEHEQTVEVLEIEADPIEEGQESSGGAGSTESNSQPNPSAPGPTKTARVTSKSRQANASAKAKVSAAPKPRRDERPQADTGASVQEKQAEAGADASANADAHSDHQEPFEPAATVNSQVPANRKTPSKATKKSPPSKSAKKPANKQKSRPAASEPKRKPPARQEFEHDDLDDEEQNGDLGTGSSAGRGPSAEEQSSRPLRRTTRVRKLLQRQSQAENELSEQDQEQDQEYGEEEQQEEEEEEEVDEVAPVKRRRKRRSRPAAALGEAGQEEEDAEKHEINPAETQMNDLTRDSGKGRMGKIEKRMMEINWEEVARKRKEAEEREFEEAERERAEQEINARLDRAGEQSSGQNVGAPKTKIVNGEIVIDNSSLVLDRHAAAAADADNAVVEENEEDDYTKKVNLHSHIHDNRRDPEERRIMKMKSDPWTDEQTEEFYNALAMFGTDFFIISKMFPGKTRRQIKLKFIREERADMARVNRVLLGKENPQSMSVEKYAEATGHEETHYKHATDVAAELEASKQETMEELQRQKQAQEDLKNDRARKAQEKIEATKQERAAKRAARKNKKGKGIADAIPDDGGEIIGVDEG